MTSQVAITLLKNLEQSLDNYCGLNNEGKTAFNMAITALEQFGNSEQLHTVNSLLTVQSDMQEADIVEIMEQLRNARVTILPSAEPEIIRCKDCENWIPGYITDNDDFIPPKCGKYQQMVGHSSNDYCSLAERRTDE